MLGESRSACFGKGNCRTQKGEREKLRLKRRIGVILIMHSYESLSEKFNTMHTNQELPVKACPFFPSSILPPRTRPYPRNYPNPRNAGI